MTTKEYNTLKANLLRQQREIRGSKEKGRELLARHGLLWLLDDAKPGKSKDSKRA